MDKKLILFEEFNKIQEPIHSEIAIKTLHIIIQVQVYHWETNNFSQHKIFDDFNDKFKVLGDKLVEVISGIYGRVKLPENLNLPLRNISDLDPVGFINQAIDLYSVYKTNVVQDHQEVISIIDEILTLFQQTKYLLSFD